ncbi:MAG: hypothetical protein FH758_04640 [Firmicutes bacterium]|nr:hypothetical protein [Bacillota bacterium]
MQQQLMGAIKNYHLGSFYMSLPVELKDQWVNDALGLPMTVVPSYKGSTFAIESAAQLLWTSAANAIPQGHYTLAEKLLIKALKMASTEQDKAWIHGNLAQLYYLQIKTHPTALEKCRYHCKQTIQTGYFVNWCERLLSNILTLDS